MYVNINYKNILNKYKENIKQSTIMFFENGNKIHIKGYDNNNYIPKKK